MAARPLEAPRPLPPSLHALARSITGRPHPPRYTTGPATRQALAAAGALGATTGSVVHLAAAPAGGAAATAVLAHELAHTRSPVRRPRFLLAGAAGLLDDDERQAVAAGRELLTGGAPANAANAANAVGSANAAGAAEAVSAGIVDRLPVGAGLGGIRELVTQTTQAVIEAMPQVAPPVPVPGMGSDLAALPSGGAFPAVPGLGGGSAAGGLAEPATSSAAPAGPIPATPASAGAAATPTGGAAGAQQPLDPDKVVAIVEERLLREIERRGGRWAGVF